MNATQIKTLLAEKGITAELVATGGGIDRLEIAVEPSTDPPLVIVDFNVDGEPLWGSLNVGWLTDNDVVWADDGCPNLRDTSTVIEHVKTMLEERTS